MNKINLLTLVVLFVFIIAPSYAQQNPSSSQNSNTKIYNLNKVQNLKNPNDQTKSGQPKLEPTPIKPEPLKAKAKIEIKTESKNPSLKTATPSGANSGNASNATSGSTSGQKISAPTSTTTTAPTSATPTKKSTKLKNSQAVKAKNYAPQNELKPLINPVSITNLPSPTTNQPSLTPTINSSTNSADSNQFRGKDFAEKSPIKSSAKTNSNDSKSLTAGNYFGIDFINTDMSFREVWYKDSGAEKKPFSTESKNSYGIKYMYALNFNKLFVAPEIFYEKTNIRKNSDLDDSFYKNLKRFELYGFRWLDIQSRMGAKLNVGYDVNPYFAPYVFAGYSLTKYKNLWSAYSFSFDTTPKVQDYFISNYGQDPFVIKSGSAGSPFYGFGTKIKISSRFFLNTEYVALNFKMKTGHKRIDNDLFTTSDTNPNKVNLNTRLKIIKVGLTYNF